MGAPESLHRHITFSAGKSLQEPCVRPRWVATMKGIFICHTPQGTVADPIFANDPETLRFDSPFDLKARCSSSRDVCARFIHRAQRA